MRTIKRILAASGLTGMLAALAFAATASADPGVDRIKGACITQGTVKVNPPVPFTGGTGTYVYHDLGFVCVAIEMAKGGILQAVGLVVLDITSPGTYTNLICGTGKALSGNATVNGNPTIVPIAGTMKTNTQAEWQTIANDLDYVVEFIAFNGLLKWRNDPAQKVDIEVPKLLSGLDFTGFPGGYVLIVPDETKASPLPFACTKAFHVVAALAIDWSPA